MNAKLVFCNSIEKQKHYIAEEFNDHLEGLKQEYIDKGVTEDEAVVKAIEDFGNGKELSKKLNYSLLNYRTKSNILFGIGYLILVTLFHNVMSNNLSVSRVDIKNPIEVILFTSVSVIVFILNVSPNSYFIP